ncbi:hypothetical protein D9M69_662710 [compost metagenome]
MCAAWPGTWTVAGWRNNAADPILDGKARRAGLFSVWNTSPFQRSWMEPDTVTFTMLLPASAATGEVSATDLADWASMRMGMGAFS